MEHFYKALTSEVKNEALPEEFNFFGKLIGRWKIDYVDNSTSRVMKANGIFHGFLREWRYRMLLSCPALNTEQRFVFTTLAHTLGMSHIATQEKLCGLRRESKTISSSLQTLRTKGENGSLPKSRTIVFIGKMLR